MASFEPTSASCTRLGPFKDTTAPQQLKVEVKYSKVPKAQSFELYIFLMDGSSVLDAINSIGSLRAVVV